MTTDLPSPVFAGDQATRWRLGRRAQLLAVDLDAAFDAGCANGRGGERGRS